MEPFEKFTENFQKSWDTHMEAFGPILGPAFMNNFEAKVHLVSALNSISKNEIQKGFAKLSIIKDMCSCNEDFAVFYFSMGLGFELSGMQKEMCRCYEECVKYEPDFSLPYLMIAKCAHSAANLEYAEKNYKKCAEFLEKENLPKQTPFVRASIYTNYFSCLTSLGKYEKAEKILKKSEEIFPDMPQRLHYAAILYAYMGNLEKLFEYMEKLKNTNMELYLATKKLIEELTQ